MPAVDVDPGAIPAGNWSSKGDVAEELLAEVMALRPDRSEFTGPGGVNADGVTYSTALGVWQADVAMAADTVGMLRELESGFATLPDGTIVPIGSAGPELRAQIEAANERNYHQLLNRFNLDSYKTQNDVAQAQFNNQISTFNAKRGLDQDAQSKAEARVNRQLGGLAESRARADLQTQSLLDAAPYASPSGKTAFSGPDIGAPAASWMSRLGLNPNESLLRFTGTQTIDPEGLMAKYDQGFGVNGELTGIPDSLLGMGDIPAEPQFGAAPGMLGPTRPNLTSLLDQVSSTQGAPRTPSSIIGDPFGAMAQMGGSPHTPSSIFAAMQRVGRPGVPTGTQDAGGLDFWGYRPEGLLPSSSNWEDVKRAGSWLAGLRP